jgi:DNA-binding response OmpR family regulator
MANTEEKRKVCILLAEDELNIRRLLSDTLTNEGFEVLTAEDGQSALRHARSHEGRIDLLITDVEMPKLDGFDLQERLRQERPGVKLLVISGTLGSNIEGADFPLLRKPFLPRELAAKVRQILGEQGVSA